MKVNFLKNKIKKESRAKSKSKKGATLFEVLLIIAIIGILAALVLPGFAKIKRIQVLKSTTEEIVSVVGKARSQTLASIDSSEYGVHFASEEIVLFKGISYSEDDPNNEITEILSPASVSSINLTGGVVNLYFNKLSGLPNVSGSVTVTVPGATSKVITISAIGSTSSN